MAHLAVGAGSHSCMLSRSHRLTGARAVRQRPRDAVKVTMGPKEWVAYIKKQTSCSCVAVNSHSKESIKELKVAARTKVRDI